MSRDESLKGTDPCFKRQHVRMGDGGRRDKVSSTFTRLGSGSCQSEDSKLAFDCD